MPRYRKISTCLHGDDKVQQLSRPRRANGYDLWIHLLIGPHTTNIPGLFRTSVAILAEENHWKPSETARALDEILSREMARFDAEARVMWLPKAIEHNEPDNPNVITSWGVAWDELPACKLKAEAWDVFYAHMLGRDRVARERAKAKGKPDPGPVFEEAFLKACAHPFGNPSGNGLGNGSVNGSTNGVGNLARARDQEQDQEQELIPYPLTPSPEGKGDQACTYCGATEDQTGVRHELRPVVGFDEPQLVCHVCEQASKGRTFTSLEAARTWLQQAYWSSNRARWKKHREIAFQGKPPTRPGDEPPPSPVWEQVLERLRTATNNYTVRSWFEPLRLVSDDGECLTLRAQSEDFRSYVERNHRQHLQQACESVREGLQVRIVVNGTPPPEPTVADLDEVTEADLPAAAREDRGS